MKIVYADLDDTVADFTGADCFKHSFDVSHMYEPGFFLGLKPIDGALVAVRQIARLGYDIHILSQPLAESAHSYSEKIQWIGLWFPELINKVHLTQHKGLFKGDYLIDDNKEKWQDKFEANGGKFVHFENWRGNKLDSRTIGHKDMWKEIVEFFKGELDGKD